MTLLLMAVSFTHPVTIPGVSSTSGGLTEFPPKGWAAIEGWSMRIVGDRLEIVSPPGAGTPAFYKPEYAANGIDERQAVNVASVPLQLCILRYGGVPDEAGLAMADGAPVRQPKESPTIAQTHLDAAAALARLPETRLGPPVDFAALTKPVAAPPPKPPEPPRRPPMPTPAARRPPGARGPSKPTNIVRDVDESEAERVTASKAERPKLETRPAFGGEGDEPAEVDLD